MLSGCRLKRGWIRLTVSLHQAPRTWQKQPPIGYTTLDNGLHRCSQRWHLSHKRPLLVFKMSGNMPFAPECAVDTVLQQKQAYEHAMKGELPLHPDGNVLALNHDWKHAEKPDKVFC